MDVVRLFGKNTRHYRKLRGLTQEALAFSAGMERSYLSDLERGTRNPTVEMLGRLAKALDVPYTALVEVREKAKP